MRRKLKAFAIIAVSISAAAFSGCEGDGAGGAPQNLALAGTNYGQEVMLSWEEPAQGTPDEYVAYFHSIDSAAFIVAATAHAESLGCTHDPDEMTGDYYVAARFGGTEYSTDTLTTIPVHTEAVSLCELNAAGAPAYGWDLAGDFIASAYYLTTAANAPVIDLYITNFAYDTTAGPWPAPWYVASPDTATDDPGANVPLAEWRVTWFSDPLPDPQAILPNFAPTTYFKCMSGIDGDTAHIGVYLDAEHLYGLMRFYAADTATGTIQAESWIQRVPDLRLLRH